MRTKVLALSAMLGLAISTSVMAQSNVYSLNAVGYVNSSFPPGFSIFCNPLATTNNSLDELFPNFPPGTQVFKFNGASFQISTFDDLTMAWDPNLTLAPGEAAWMKNVGATPLQATFVGEVMQGSLTNALPVGFSLKASYVPQQGTLGPNDGSMVDLAVPGQPGDQVFKYNPATSGFQISTFDDLTMAWDPNLTINVGEGFWVKKLSQENWVRAFSVNNN